MIDWIQLYKLRSIANQMFLNYLWNVAYKMKQAHSGTVFIVKITNDLYFIWIYHSIAVMFILHSFDMSDWKQFEILRSNCTGKEMDIYIWTYADIFFDR